MGMEHVICRTFFKKWVLNEFGIDLKEHLEIIVIGIVLVSTLPVI